MGYLIGADIGSQSIKAVLLDPDGDHVAPAAGACAMTHPARGLGRPGPGAVARRPGRGRPARCSRSGDRRRARSPIWALPARSTASCPSPPTARPLRDSIIWLDRRASEQSRRLADEVGVDWLFATTGLNADASHIAPKIMWLRDCEPETYRATAVMASVGGYLLGWLTGLIAQDHANASSTLLYDIRRREWSETLLAAAGIDPAALPEIRPSHEIAGRLRADTAQRLGLTTRCCVVVGTGDEHAASLGAGAWRRALITDVTGTAEPVTAVAAEIVFDSERLVETHAHAVDGAWLIENPGFVSGGSTLWLAENVLGVPQGELFDLAATAPAGSDGVLFLPTLCGATAPRWNDRVRGVFAGLSLNHGGGHLARAVLEGCAFALRDIVVRLDAHGARRSRDPRGGRRRPQSPVDADQGRRHRASGARGPRARAHRAWARPSWPAWLPASSPTRPTR